MRRAYKYLLFLGLCFVAIFALSMMADGASADTHTWDGGGADAKASTSGNWDNNIVPVAGDSVTFGSGSTKSCTFDLNVNIATFTIQSGYTGTITVSPMIAGNTVTTLTQSGGTLTISSVAEWTITTGTFSGGTCNDNGPETYGTLTINGGTWNQGSAISVTGSISHTSGTLAGSSSYLLTVAGDFTTNGGTFTANVMKLKMTGTSKTLLTTGDSFHTFQCSGTITFSASSTGLTVSNTLTIDSGKTLTNNDAITFTGSTFTNSGTIGGYGTLTISLTSADLTITPGTLDCYVYVKTASGASASRTCTLGGNLAGAGSLTISSDHATYTSTLATSTYTITCHDITLGDRGITTGSGAVTVNGPMTVNGAGSCYWNSTGTFNSDSISITSGTFKQGMAVTIDGDMTIDGGIYTASTSYTTTVAGNFNFASGTCTTGKLKLIMTGTSKTFYFATGYLRSFTASGSTTMTSGMLLYDSSVGYGELTINSGKSIEMGFQSITLYEYTAVGKFSNSGSINGADGVLTIYIRDVDETLILGDVNCKVKAGLTSSGGSISNRVYTLGENINVPVEFQISSLHTTYTCTVATGSYTLTCGSLYFNNRGILSGAGAVTVNGLVSVAGAGSCYYNGTGALDCDGLTVSNGYFNQGNNVIVEGTLTVNGGTLALSSSYTTTISGDYTWTSGTVYAGVGKMTFTGIGKTATLLSYHGPHTLTVNNGASLTVTRTGGGTWYIYKTLSNAGTISISSGTALQWIGQSTGSWSNTGSYSGSGYLEVANTAGLTFVPGTIDCPLRLILRSDEASGRTLTLGGNLVVGNSVNIYSGHGTYVLTVATGAYSITCPELTLGDRATLSGAGTVTMTTGTGLLTVNGASASYAGTGVLSCKYLTVTSGTFTQGNTVTVSYNVLINGGVLTPSNSYMFNCGGDFTYSSGTLTNYVLKLDMTGTGKVATFADGQFILTLVVDGTTTVTSGTYVQIFNLDVNSGKTLTIATGIELRLISSASYTTALFANDGTITGEGTMVFSMYSADASVALGTINCAVKVLGRDTMTADRVLSLSAGSTTSSTVTIVSDSLTYTVTLNLAGYSLSSTSITLGDRGKISNTGGATTLTTSGAFTQSGASSQVSGDIAFDCASFTFSSGTFAQGGNITAPSFIQSGGAFTGSTSDWLITESYTKTTGTLVAGTLSLKMNGASNTISINAGVEIYSLWVAGGTTYSSGYPLHITGGTLVIGNGMTFTQSHASGSIILEASGDNAVDNHGTFAFESFVFEASVDVVIGNLGIIDGPVTFTIESDSTGSRIYTMSEDLTGFTDVVTIGPGASSYTCTVSTAGYALTAPSLTILSGGVLSAGTSTITIPGAFNGLAGEYVAGTSRMVLSGTGTASISASSSFYNLDVTGTRTLGSDIVVGKRLTITGALTFGAYHIEIDSDVADSVHIDTSFDGTIYLNGTATTNTITVPSSYLGTIYFTEPTTIQLPSMSFMVQPTASLNLTMKGTSPMAFFVGMASGNATFMVPNMIANGTYRVTVDGTASYYVCDESGVVSWFKNTWSTHYMTFEAYYYFAPLVDEVLEMTGYNDTTYSAFEGNWTMTTNMPNLVGTTYDNNHTFMLTGDGFTNADVGTYWVNISIVGTYGSYYDNFTFEVVNTPPIFYNDPGLNGVFESRYHYYPETDQDAYITWTFTTDSYDLKMDPIIGHVYGTFNNYQLVVQCSLKADDGNGGITYQNWTIDVSMLSWNLRVDINIDFRNSNRVQFNIDTPLDRDTFTKVMWVFGDGQGSRLYEPIHEYRANGTYVVYLYVWDIYGHLGKDAVYVNVGNITGSDGSDGTLPTPEDDNQAFFQVIIGLIFLAFFDVLMISVIRSGKWNDANAYIVMIVFSFITIVFVGQNLVRFIG